MYWLTFYVSVVHAISIKVITSLLKNSSSVSTHTTCHFCTSQQSMSSTWPSSSGHGCLPKTRCCSAGLAGQTISFGDNSPHCTMGTHKRIISAPIATHSLGDTFKTVDTTEEPEKQTLTGRTVLMNVPNRNHIRASTGLVNEHLRSLGNAGWKTTRQGARSSGYAAQNPGSSMGTEGASHKTASSISVLVPFFTV